MHVYIQSKYTPVPILGTLPLVLGLAAAGGFLDEVPGGLYDLTT